MAYFLGRDVNCYINVESVTTDNEIFVSGTTSVAPTIRVGGSAGTDCILFAADMQAGVALSNYTAYGDIVGVEVDMSVMDEDTSYIGQKQSGKVEIKKEYTVSLTRKKFNDLWDVIYNGDGTNTGRYGLNSGESGLGDGLVNPTSVQAVSATSSAYGYRISLNLKTGTAGNSRNEETICFPNCCITGYSTTLNADGTQEETLEFMTNQQAIYGLSGDELNNTLTLRADM